MNFFQVKSFFRHWLLTVDEHSIHSPFFYDFYSKVIKAEKKLDAFLEIEQTRSRLLSNDSNISVIDMGAKSNYFSTHQRTIGQVARTSVSPQKWCMLMANIIEHLDCKKVVELGTSMGVMSLYLAKRKEVEVVSFEGNHDMVNIALTNFEYFEKKNIHLIEGNIDSTLAVYLQTPTKIDLVLMDANHRYEPTVRYFELLSKRMAPKGVIVVDDIYHSKEMGRAWNELRKHTLVYGSLDLFRCGILFLDPALNKQHFICSY